MTKPTTFPPFDHAPSEWGATKDYDSWTDPYIDKDGLVIHYGGGANTAGSVTGVYAEQIDDETAVLRGWERYHVGTRDPETGELISGQGWRGLAYNWAIGQSGRLYRVRSWALNGAHWGNDDIDEDGIPANAEKIAVVFILGGDQIATPEAIATFERLRAWLETELGRPLTLHGHGEVAASGSRVDYTGCPGPLQSYVEANRSSSPSEPEPAPVPVPPVLQTGDRDKAVVVVRSILYALGYTGAYWIRARRFTAGLRKEIKRFQRVRRITVDGKVGPETWAELVDAHAEAFGHD